MQPIRLILEDAPEHLPIPTELRHQRIEVIFWPLEATHSKSSSKNRETPQERLAQVLAKPPRSILKALCLDTKRFHFNRDEANER
jgi:hypothetical protein